MPRGREIFLQGQEQGPKESFSLNERHSSFKGRIQKKNAATACGLLPRRIKASIQPHHLQNEPAKRVAAAAPPAQKVSARVDSMMWPKIGNAYAAPPKAKASPWQQASAKTTVHVHITWSSHIDGPFIVESSHRLRYLLSSGICTLPLRLRALTVLEAGRSVWLGVASR